MGILLIVLLLSLIIFIFIPIRISVFYDSVLIPKYNIVINAMFFKFPIKTNKKNKSKKNKLKEYINNFSYLKTKLISDKQNIDYFDLIKETYNILSPITKKLLKHFKITNIEYYYILRDDDAAKIGIKYGKLNIYIYNIYNIIHSIFNIKKSKIFIYPDFINNSDSQTKTIIEVKFSLIYILLTIFSLAINLYVYKKGNQNN